MRAVSRCLYRRGYLVPVRCGSRLGVRCRTVESGGNVERPAYVPGRHVHPRFWRSEGVQPSDDAWEEGWDLFSRGFYWEAHEAWEAVWHATGHEGPLSEFLKGLIKLTAAGVKVRQGQVRPLRTHAERAREHFVNCRNALGVERLGGLVLDELIEIAERVARDAESWTGDPAKDVEIVFDFVHFPEDL